MFSSELFKFYKRNILSEMLPSLKNVPYRLQEDIIKIKYFLQNKAAILVALNRLELALLKTLALKNIDYQQFIKSTGTKDHKVLSDTLKQWLQQTAFSPNIAEVRSFLPATFFFEYLKNKVLLKDIGSSPFHGEWSHFIQWYLICNNHELCNALSSSPVIIYQMLGSLSFNAAIDNEDDTLWSMAVDRLYISENVLYEDFDFSCPEFITDFLVKEKDTFPVLSTCVNKRLVKRIRSEQNLSHNFST